MIENLNVVITIIALIYLFIYPVTLFLFWLNKVNLSKTQIYVLSFVLVISLSFISTKIIPGESFDLSVYYRIYDRFQYTGNIGLEFSNNVILFKIILYFLCNLPSKLFIQFFFIFATYSLVFLCFFFIYKLFKDCSEKNILFSLIMQETLMSFAYIYSGGRNQLAFGMAALSIILINYRRQNNISKIVSLLLLIISFLIHDSVIIIAVIFIASIIPIFQKYPYLILGWSLFIPIVLFLDNITPNFRLPLTEKIVLYVTNAFNTLDYRITILNILIIIFLLFVIKMTPFHHKQINNFLLIVLFFALGATVIP